MAIARPLKVVVGKQWSVAPPPTGPMWDPLSTGVVGRSFAECRLGQVSRHKVLRGALTMAVLAADDKLDGDLESRKRGSSAKGRSGLGFGETIHE